MGRQAAAGPLRHARRVEPQVGNDRPSRSTRGDGPRKEACPLRELKAPQFDMLDHTTGLGKQLPLPAAHRL